MQATQRFQTMPVPIAQTIRGEVSDPTSRYAVNLDWNGSRINGRLGGWWFAEKISLERSPHGLIGFVTSRSVHLTVNVRLVGARLELLIASRGETQQIEIVMSDRSTGIWRVQGCQPTPIHLEQTASGHVIHAGERRVSLNAPSSPAWVVVSAGLVSLAAHQAVSTALLESLKELREH